MRRAIVLMTLALATLPSRASSQDEHPVHWIARGSRIAIRAGDTTRITLHATIGEFFHLYSPTQGPGGPVPTTFSIVPSNEYSIIGRVRAATPEKIPDANFGIMTEVYDDSVTIGITLRADRRLRAGRSQARLGVRYQACTARYCLPPRVDTISIPVQVSKP